MVSISVIMTFFNETPSLLDRSIYSILNQTFQDIEYIIISGNPENTEGNAYVRSIEQKDPRVKFYTFDQKLLMTVCLNIAIKKSIGRYIALQEADDESLPSRLQMQFDFMEANEQYHICGTAIAYIDNETQKVLLERFYPNDNNKSFNRYAAIAHPTILVRKETYEKFGYYSEEPINRNSPDFELWSRWKTKGVNFYSLDNVLFRYFQSKNNGRNKNVKPTLQSVIRIKKLYKKDLDFTLKDEIFLILEQVLFLVPSKLISELFYIWGKLSQKKA